MNRRTFLKTLTAAAVAVTGSVRAAEQHTRLTIVAPYSPGGGRTFWVADLGELDWHVLRDGDVVFVRAGTSTAPQMEQPPDSGGWNWCRRRRVRWRC